MARPNGPGSRPSGHAPADREASPVDPSRGSPAPGVQWWAWSEPDADSDPSDPGVGHSTDWLIGRWPSGADEPECKILIGSGRNAELIARRVAEKLRSILNTDFIKASKDSTETRPVCDLHKDCPEDTHLCSWPKCMSAEARESTWGASVSWKFKFDRPILGRVEDALLRLGRAAIRTRGIGQHEEAARAQFECLTDIERLVGEQLEEEAAASWSWDEIGSRLRDCSIHTVADHERERYTLQIGCPDLQNMQAIRDGMVQLRDAAPSATTAAVVTGIDLKALAGAIDNSDHGYSIKLKSLTETGSVYTLDLCDGSGLIEFADRDDAREHAERHRSLVRAKAALAFLSAKIRASKDLEAPDVHWSAWPETDADSDPSDPDVTYYTEWFVGRWPNGSEEPDCRILIGMGRAAEIIARRVAEKLTSILNTDRLHSADAESPLDTLRPMSEAPTGVPIIAWHKPNAAMPHGWVATIKLGHGDDEAAGCYDTILHYNGEESFRGFRGMWTGWLPMGALAGEARRAETEGLGSRASDGGAGTPEATPQSSPSQTPVDPQMTVEEARDILDPYFKNYSGGAQEALEFAKWMADRTPEEEARNRFLATASRIETAIALVAEAPR